MEYLETDTCNTNLHVEYLQMKACDVWSIWADFWDASPVAYVIEVDIVLLFRSVFLFIAEPGIYSFIISQLSAFQDMFYRH